MAAGAGGDGCAAAGVEKRGQAFLNLLAVLPDADYLASVGHAENDDASFGIGERAGSLADGRQVESPLELRMPVFTCLDAVQDVQPLHDRQSESVLQATQPERIVAAVHGAHDGVTHCRILDSTLLSDTPMI